MRQPVVLGLDIGTSGVRCVALDRDGETVATGERRFDLEHRREPEAWAALADETMLEVLSTVRRDAVQAIAVDGTSGTLLALCERGNPLAPALMYDDPVAEAEALDRVAAAAPTETAAHGATSGLAKALVLQKVPEVAHLLHQADWIAGRLSGLWNVSDENNALKTGYDPVARRWGDWIPATGIRRDLLPRVVPAGTPIAPVRHEVADRFGLSPNVQVVAGTTDGCASFLATGASQIGDGVTALGSSLTIKILSDRPIFSAEHGIYSHRIAGGWLVGGASNTGGKVLAAYFDADRLAALSEDIDPEREPRLDYYPLLTRGERFPHADPAMVPRLSPRPADEAEFLHELLAGIAAIEVQGYARLASLGAPALRSLRSVGGGASNAQWTAMRQRALGAPFLPARSCEAAAGAAQLALQSLAGSGSGMMAEARPAAIAGIGEVADHYDAYLVDQFGVLHDGVTAYPEAADTLLRLRAAGKQVVLLSNSGKRSAANADRLKSLGFAPHLYTSLLSSGEVGWSILAAEAVAPDRRRKCLLIARDGDRSAIDGLPVDVTASGESCDFVLIAGSEGDRLSLSDYRAQVEPAAARGVPAYCTNPDTQMLTPQGLRFGAGQIAALYEALGGKVMWIGKPFPAIYAAARDTLGDVEPRRILCVGDSIDHDIAGARGAGLDSCLITGGILAEVAPAQLPALFESAGATPDYAAAALRW